MDRAIDREWEHAGFACEITHCNCHYCGYVIVPEWHPAHGSPVDFFYGKVDVHGGVTWSGPFSDVDGWRVGFDYGHSFDTLDPSLALDESERDFAHWHNLMLPKAVRDSHIGIDEVSAEVDGLAEQLARIGKTAIEREQK